MASERDRPASTTLRASSPLAAIGDRPPQEPVVDRQVGATGLAAASRDAPRQHVDRGVVGDAAPSTTPSAASQAASKPEDSLARPIDLSVRLLPAESIRPTPSTSPGGMSRPIVDSPKVLGLAMTAGTSERGFRTAGPSPKALGRTATRRPRRSRACRRGR